MRVIPFCGYPICIIQTGEILNENELSFLKSLDNTQHTETLNTRTKLTKGVNILNNNELTRVKDFVWKNFSNYVDKVLEVENNFYMCNSWGTIQQKGDYHPSHNHPNAVFSAVYYVQTSDSSITFAIDRSKIMEGFLLDFKIKNFNHFNALSWKVPVATGDLIIFPGELQHESQIHTGDDERMIIGSSYFVQGNLGFDENYNSIKIKDANN